MTVGERIKRMRMSQGMSAEELAAKVGVSPATIYRYENGFIGNIRVDKVSPIARVLGCSEGYLMGWEDEHGTDITGNEAQPIVPCNASETHMLELFRAMNADGQRMAMTTMESFAMNPAFQKESTVKSAM